MGKYVAPYPVTAAVDLDEGLAASFHDKLTFPSPMNAGIFECKGWDVMTVRKAYINTGKRAVENHLPESLPECCCNYGDQQ